MVWAVVASTVVSAGVGLYEGSQANKNSSAAQGLEADVQGKQDYYNNQLMQLMANPGTFLDNPLFTSTLATGTQAVNRSQAAQGFLGSGNQATALQQFGQSFASSQLTGQEQILASLSGAGNASSPSQAGSVAVSAQGQEFNQLGSLLASLGYSKGFSSGGTSTGGGGGGGANYGPWNSGGTVNFDGAGSSSNYTEVLN